MKLRYTARARSDIEEIFSYIARDNPKAAQRVRLSIFSTIETIAANPFMGIRNVRAPELRSFLVQSYPYRVHCWARSGEIVILHVRHTARRPIRFSP